MSIPNRCRFLVFMACSLALTIGVGCSPSPSPVQATQQPRGMVPFDTVKSAGSDFRALYFKLFDLPGLITLADKEYTRQAVMEHFEKLKFDPARPPSRKKVTCGSILLGKEAATLTAFA